jgi:MoaA/NifB/PqqE/SkfB family radical SAM enzyme
MNKIVAVEDNFAPKDNWLRVEWNLGKRCNYDCSYCGPDIHNKTDAHMSFNVFSATVDNVVKAATTQNKTIRVSLTGGEPFIHPEIIRFLSYMKSSGVDRISVTTNGSAGFRRYVESLQYIDYYIFSYHFEFAKHDKILENILTLDQYIKETHGRNQVHVHIMYLPGKLNEVKELISELEKHNVHWVVRRIRPKININTSKWAIPGTSGMETTDGFDSESYYSDEELKWLNSI